MKTRAMNINADQVRVSGNAWGRDLPELIIEQYGEAGVVRRVTIPVRPVDIQDFARALWTLRDKYETALNDMTSSLKHE